MAGMAAIQKVNEKNEKIFIIFIDKMIRACYIIYVNDELMVLLKIIFCAVRSLHHANCGMSSLFFFE